jgi:Cys-rich repeat protein
MNVGEGRKHYRRRNQSLVVVVERAGRRFPNEVTAMFLSRRLSCAAVVCLFACQSSPSVTFARPKEPSSAQMAQALGGTGYSASAQFNAPVVDPNSWQGTPIGSGTWSAQSTPAQSGGNQAIGAVDSASTPGQTYRYVVVGDFTTQGGHFFAVISDQPFTVGAAQIDNQHLFAGLFDASTGEPTALADSGTVTFTQVGGIGGTVAGSFSGTLDDVQSAPGCASNADCAAGQLCASGTCVSPPVGCTTDADCASGQVCAGGVCVAGSSCDGGACVPSGCVSNADCAANESCVRNTCIANSTGCTSSAQCPPGTACQSGACVPTVSSSCQVSGTGAYSGSAASVMTCSALGSGALSLTNGQAFIGDGQTGSGLAFYLFDANGGADGVLLPLSACPASPGPVQVSGQVYASAPNAGPGLQLIAVHDASGTINFTGVGHYTGTFSLTLTGGGSVTGSFDLQ